MLLEKPLMDQHAAAIANALGGNVSAEEQAALLQVGHLVLQSPIVDRDSTHVGHVSFRCWGVLLPPLLRTPA